MLRDRALIDAALTDLGDQWVEQLLWRFYGAPGVCGHGIEPGLPAYTTSK